MRVGVVGCGLVAQVMHLHYLRELAERFDVVALCDLSPESLAFANEIHPHARTFARWEDLVGEPLDVVLVLVGGSHAPVAIAAAEAGVHVFVEKPMCVSPAEGQEMVDACDRAGVRLMVGYMKRYDPAYEELAARLERGSVRFARITTLESPLEPYVSHYPLRRGAIDPDVAAALADDDERRVGEALGDVEPQVRHVYRSILLDSMIHELNAVRGLLGEPDALLFADIWGEDHSVTAAMRYGDTECVFSWIDLPGIARYEQELAFYAPSARARLVFPSPFLRSMPTRLVLEGGSEGTAASWRSEHLASYEEAFKRELVELHAAITEDREPRTPGTDGLRDVALCRAIALALHDGLPRPRPTELEAA